MKYEGTFPRNDDGFSPSPGFPGDSKERAPLHFLADETSETGPPTSMKQKGIKL